jgi:outer membrane protein
MQKSLNPNLILFKMTKILKLTFLLVILFAFTLSAQSPKFGHINSSELLGLLPGTKSADSTLQKYGSSLESQLKTMSAEYQTKLQDYQANQTMMADAIKQVKEKEIMDLQTRIQDFQQTAQESIQKKKEDLYSPVLKKVEDAIKQIAKDNGYAYIFDTSAGVFLYAQESDDISALVKKKLGISANAEAPKKEVPAVKK